MAAGPHPYTKHYLHSGGQANSLGGDGLLSPDAPGGEPADVYVSDPRDPVPTRGGAVTGWPAAMPGGAFDQRPIEERRTHWSTPAPFWSATLR